MAVLVAVVLASSVGVAAAAWRSSGTGTSVARAGTLGTPTTSTSAITCQGFLQRATVSWAAVPESTGHDVDVSTTGAFPGTTTATTSTSTTLAARSVLSRTTYSVRVRATAGAWDGPWSSTATVTLGGCLN